MFILFIQRIVQNEVWLNDLELSGGFLSVPGLGSWDPGRFSISKIAEHNDAAALGCLTRALARSRAGKQNDLASVL